MTLFPVKSYAILSQQMSRSGQLQRYEEELRNLEHELAGIRVTPNVTYDLRNRTVPRVVSNFSTSARQGAGVQNLLQPQSRVVTVEGQDRREGVPTSVQRSQRLAGAEQDRRSNPVTTHEGGRSPQLLLSPDEDSDYAQLPQMKRPHVVRREVFSPDEDSDEGMEGVGGQAVRDYSRKRVQDEDADADARGRCKGATRRSHPTRDLKSTPENTNSRKTFVKPPKFDGKGCIESHLLQFKIAASRNGWSDEEKVDFLIISLTGDASSVLKDMDEEITYDALVSKLKQRYGTLEQQEVFRIQLKGGRRSGGVTVGSHAGYTTLIHASLPRSV